MIVRVTGLYIRIAVHRNLIKKNKSVIILIFEYTNCIHLLMVQLFYNLQLIFVHLSSFNQQLQQL